MQVNSISRGRFATMPPGRQALMRGAFAICARVPMDQRAIVLNIQPLPRASLRTDERGGAVRHAAG